MKAALYCRVSTTDKGQTLEQQLKPMQDYCEQQGWPAEVFADYASGSRESRPALDRMIQRIRNKEYQILMVIRLDRLGRSLQHLLQLFQEFKKHEVRFISLTQGFDTDTAMGRFGMQMMGAVAEFERELIRERIKDKLRILKGKGKHLGRPFGSKDKHVRKKTGYWLRYASKQTSAKYVDVGKEYIAPPLNEPTK